MCVCRNIPGAAGKYSQHPCAKKGKTEMCLFHSMDWMCFVGSIVTRNQWIFHMKSRVFHGKYFSCQHCRLRSPTALTSTYLRFAASVPRKV